MKLLESAVAEAQAAGLLDDAPASQVAFECNALLIAANTAFILHGDRTASIARATQSAPGYVNRPHNRRRHFWRSVELESAEGVLVLIRYESEVYVEADLHHEYVARRVHRGPKRFVRLDQSRPSVFVYYGLDAADRNVPLGRRLAETMAYWDAPVEGYPPEHRDFARVWQKPDKIIFSRTPASVATRNARLDAISTPKRFERSSAMRGTTSASAGPSWQRWRLKPTSSTNVTYSSTR